MKLQHLSIIFIIIVIPILLIASYYIGLQIDTINLQNSYNTKLQEAAGEAMKSLEINTVEWNSNFAELADSKRRDVQASINSFISSISNKMGVARNAKEFTRNYIPAIAYTLYDGYYMYANTVRNNIEIDDDNGEAERTFNGQLNETGGQTYEHLLQSFTPYSETLTSGNSVITINYTLDNYVKVYGTIEGIGAIHKEGYLTTESDLTNKYSGFVGENLSENICYTIDDINYTVANFPYVYGTNNTKYYKEGDRYFSINLNNHRYDLTGAHTLDIQKKNNTLDLTTNTYGEESLYPDPYGNVPDSIDYSALNYVHETEEFTNWFNNNIADKNWTSNVTGSVNAGVFNIEGNNNPDPEIGDDYYNSLFTQHKREVMRESIERNLQRVVADANSHLAGATYEYRLPELTENDWDKLLSNVSIIAFLQGVPTGLKYYNNYAIASSSNNNEYVNPEQIYLSSDTDTYYHRKDCSEIQLVGGGTVTGYKSTDYIMRREGPEDHKQNYYKHANGDISSLGCYHCIIDQNNDIATAGNAYPDEYYTALARERYVSKQHNY